jgi:predicted RecB family nuclease
MSNPFRLKEFRGVDAEHVEKLAAAGIKTAEQMLAAGQTAEKRAALAQDTGIPEEAILELVKLSDLARLPGVKGIRARLYYDAGVGCVEEMADCEAEALLALTAEFVERTGFDGIAPLPKEVSSTIANAKRLPRVVEW